MVCILHFGSGEREGERERRKQREEMGWWGGQRETEIETGEGDRQIASFMV